jgi:hypothetical protein
MTVGGFCKNIVMVDILACLLVIKSPIPNNDLGACTIKNYGFVMYGLRNKLECLSKPVKGTDN